MRPNNLVLASASVCLATALALSPVMAQQSASSSPATGASVNDTGINQRDRNGQAVTPFDQPNDKTDIRLAAAVRRKIVKDKALSTSAHNIKLVAANGVVTLRGPVKNDDEKATVETLVKGVSGVTQVNNQLDVKN